MPTPYTAYAELLCQPRRFFWETKEDDPKFETYKQTTMRRIKDPVLLAGALRDPEVAKTRYVKESHDVLEQLSQELKISSPALEFIRLELSGENPAELTTILNAVLDKFIADVVDRERDERKDRLGALEKMCPFGELPSCGWC